MLNRHKAWKRACDKCSPSKTTNLSPVNPIYAHVKTKEDDAFLQGLLLATMLSEENYYINSISLVHEFQSNEKKFKAILNRFWARVNLLEQLEHVYYIAKGAYGKVFEAVDKISKRKLAIKNIIPNDDTEYSHLLSLWKIFMERNVLLTANDCPFMTRMFASFQDADKKSFWIFMEYCSCTLSDLIQNLFEVNLTDICSKFIRGKPIIEQLRVATSQSLQLNYHELVFIYFFELLAALHYLADRHIIHADIKPDNILFSPNGHIKLSDLGAAQRYRWVDKRSALYVMKDFDKLKEQVKELDFDFKRSGNTVYLDPETTFRYYKKDDKDIFRAVVKTFGLSEFTTHDKMTRQTFLTDYYAVGVIIFEMLLAGVVINHPGHFDRALLAEMKMTKIEIYFLNITWSQNQELYHKLIVSNFLKSMDKTYSELSNLLIKSLLSRPIRAQGVTRNLSIFRNNEIEIEPAIDLKKIERLKYFQDRKISIETVTGFVFPKTVLQYFYSSHDDNRRSIDMSKLKFSSSGLSLPAANYQYRSADF